MDFHVLILRPSDFNGLRIALAAGAILLSTIPVLSLLIVLRVHYPKLTESKAVGIPVVVFLLCLPFVLTKLLAGFMLYVVLS